MPRETIRESRGHLGPGGPRWQRAPLLDRQEGGHGLTSLPRESPYSQAALPSSFPGDPCVHVFVQNRKVSMEPGLWPLELERGFVGQD